MKRGALDYLVKPFGVAEVQALVAKALRTQALEREVHELRREVARRIVPGDRLVGKSPELLEIFKTVGRVAGRDISTDRTRTRSFEGRSNQVTRALARGCSWPAKRLCLRRAPFATPRFLPRSAVRKVTILSCS